MSFWNVRRSPSTDRGRWFPSPPMTYLPALTCLLAVGVVCCSRPASTPKTDGPVPLSIGPTSAPGSLAPQLSTGGVLSWLEPWESGEGHRLRFSRLSSQGWGPVRTVVEGSAFFANWADVPSVVEEGDGSYLAHWLERLGEGTYAYGIRLAQSTDKGVSWSPLGWLHDDTTAAEHGFATLLPSPEGTWGFWLDGRSMPGGGAMALRGVEIGVRDAAAVVLDPRVCECCQTDAAQTPSGPLVVYRGRSVDEVRDIRWVRRSTTGWSKPRTLAVDGWQIAGCPVNGPAVAASEENVAVAWFTAAQERPRVQVAFSENGGESFGLPLELDDRQPLGRVDIAPIAGGEFVVSWLARESGTALLKVKRVRSDGAMGTAESVAETAPSRSAGVPRILSYGNELLLTWVETGPERKLRTLRLGVDRLPESVPGGAD